MFGQRVGEAKVFIYFVHRYAEDVLLEEVQLRLWPYLELVTKLPAVLVQDVVLQGDHFDHLALELFDAVAEGQVLLADLHVLSLMTLGNHQIEVLLTTIAVDHVELNIGVWLSRAAEGARLGRSVHILLCGLLSVSVEALLHFLLYFL